MSRTQVKAKHFVPLLWRTGIGYKVCTAQCQWNSQSLPDAKLWFSAILSLPIFP
jgi:hypothetical protein